MSLNALPSCLSCAVLHCRGNLTLSWAGPSHEQIDICFKNNVKTTISINVDHGRRGDKFPIIWSGGRQCKLSHRFCHIGTKMSVLWPSKYAKIPFRPASARTPLGSSRRSPGLPNRLGKGYPSPYPSLLGTDQPSVLARRPPEF